MFLKNLLRRKIRTLLTITGIAVGVATIVALGAMADGIETGYGSMLTGSKADLILSQPDAFDPTYSSIDENVGLELTDLPEISEICGMLQGFSNAEGEPFLFVFGYQKDCFVMERIKILAGDELYSRTADQSHGNPVMIGKAASEVMGKKVGDTLRLVGSVFRVVGVYETGDNFEDSGIVMRLEDAQELLGKPHQVSIFYLRLKNPGLRQRFLDRFERQHKNLEISGAEEFADKQMMATMLRGFVWVIGGLAIILGGIGMMNAQLMSVMERTHEIGALRAMGWSSQRVMGMIINESLSVCLVGGGLGLGLGYLMLTAVSKVTVIMGATTTAIRPGLVTQSAVIVLVLGLFGGIYPAWRASRMQPVEALRYEGGGSGGKVHRLPFGGMAVQSLWQRTGRTLLTLSVIAVTVGTIMALESLIRGFTQSFSAMLGTNAEIMIRQADISDTELSIIDERVGEKIAAMAQVKGVSGIFFTAAVLPGTSSFFILWGYAPNEFAIQHFRVVEGESLTTNHQVILGRMMANIMKRKVGDTIELSGTRFRVVGIYESSTSWEELGGVVSLRDAQVISGRPRKVMMYAVMVNDRSQASQLVEEINAQFPEIYATLSGEFVDQMPDMKTLDGLIGGISFLSIIVGGVGVLNTMLMSVFERTREIGVLRALGWRRRIILGMILREALILGFLGAAAGIILAFVLANLMIREPTIGGFFSPRWDLDIFARAIAVATVLGLIGGIYPAYRATRLLPVEALRYE